MSTSIFLPDGLPERVAAETRAAGAEPVETGGFMLADATGHVSVVALSGESDVHRERDLFVIGSGAIAALFDWAAARSLRVAVQWHSHRLRAFLSETDLAYAFNVPGFRNCIVPNYERPSAIPSEWGWWVFAKGWTESPSPEVVAEGFSVVTFEAGNVREH
jgi:hypothetical protein